MVNEDNPNGANGGVNGDGNSRMTFHSSRDLTESQKLAGASNYATWSVLMKAILVCDGVWDVVDGRVVNEEKNDRAFSKLLLNIRTQIFPLVIACTGESSAKTVWTKLKNNYGNSGLTSQVRHLRKLFKMQFTDFDSMEAYTTEALSTNQCLTEMKVGLSDAMLSIVMLAGLPEEFDTYYPN